MQSVDKAFKNKNELRSMNSVNIPMVLSNLGSNFAPLYHHIEILDMSYQKHFTVQSIHLGKAD